MRFSSLCREAGRNIATGTARFALLSVLLGVALGSLVFIDGMTTSGLIAAAERFRSSGAATETLVAEGRVDGEACEALSRLPGVTAAGALRSSASKITIATLPDAPVPLHEVSPGFVGILTDRMGLPGGVLVPDELAETLGVSAGEVVASDAGPMPIAAVYDYPSDGRRAGFGYAILAVTNQARTYDECWAQAWPQLPNLRSLLLATVIPSDGADERKPQVSQLNSSLGALFEGSAAFADRMTRLATPTAAAIAAGLGLVSVRSRRLQQASALHAGVTRSDLFALNLLEGGAWAGSAGAIGMGIVVAVAATIAPGDHVAVFQSLASIPLAGVAGALVGVAMGTAAMSERQLFRYFKDR
ncbi:hypothetical protein [Leifsonia sp. P73]|uniref:hypothetical protein n=1 Tax=Leifsonia sp. P73 TaxID=3423959 RepID=UPI003DA51E57